MSLGLDKWLTNLKKNLCFFFLPLGGSRIERHQKKGNWRKIKYRWSCHDVGLGEEDGKEVYFCKHEFLGLLKGDHCSFRNIIWPMASHRGASSLSQTYQNKTYVLTMYICLCVGGCVHECGYLWRPEGVESPGAGVTGDCELPIMGAGNWPGSCWRAGSTLLLLSIPPACIPSLPDVKHSDVLNCSDTLLSRVYNMGQVPTQLAAVPIC